MSAKQACLKERVGKADSTENEAMAACTFDPSSQEAEPGGSMQVPGHLGLHSETLFQKKEQTNTQTNKNRKAGQVKWLGREGDLSPSLTA